MEARYFLGPSLNPAVNAVIIYMCYWTEINCIHFLYGIKNDIIFCLPVYDNMTTDKTQRRAYIIHSCTKSKRISNAGSTKTNNKVSYMLLVHMNTYKYKYENNSFLLIRCNARNSKISQKLRTIISKTRRNREPRRTC